jgi:hypothetical protein
MLLCMPPLKLSDDQLATVLRAAAPLARAQRSGFLQAVADALGQLAPEQIADGTVHKVCRALQRQFWDPPINDKGALLALDIETSSGKTEGAVGDTT